MTQLKRVIFIRSGETDWNLAGRWQGWLDIPLNEHGHQQAIRLASFVRHLGIESIWSSDLRRASQTADAIAEACGLPVQTDRRLRERNIGNWQGMNIDEVRKWFPDQYAAYTNDRLGYAIPEGESLQVVRARMMDAFQDIVIDSEVSTLAIVAHTVSVRILIAAFVPDYQPMEIQMGNTAVTTTERDGNHWIVRVSNDIEHLQGMISRTVSDLEVQR